MKTKFALLITGLLLLSILPGVLATDTGGGIGIDFETEDFAPRVWMCDHRKVIDDPIQDGRVNGDEVCSLKPQQECISDDSCEWSAQRGCILKGYELVERTQNYAFEGEKIEWAVLVMDKNKIEEVTDVVATVGSNQGIENDVEVECVRLPHSPETIPEVCNARLGEEKLKDFDHQTMAFYECTLTVEPGMYGEYWVTVEAIDASGLSDTMDENEFWFFNPIIALKISDSLLDFEGEDRDGVRPGTLSYSQTITVENDADSGSGVLLDMFISGTDFYDPDPVGARCVITNRLKLGDNYDSPGLETSNNVCAIGFGDTDDHLCYFASNGAYSTQTDPRSDAEGYVPIVYGDRFDTDFYNDAEIMQPFGPFIPGYQPGNILAPGAEIALTFKLGLPEPCVGDFTDGDIFFWGEAI